MKRITLLIFCCLISICKGVDIAPIKVDPLICIYKFNDESKIIGYWVVYGDRKDAKRSVAGYTSEFLQMIKPDYFIAVNGNLEDVKIDSIDLSIYKEDSVYRIITVKNGFGITNKNRINFSEFIEKSINKYEFVRY